jgi:isoaspartyl peptidase/L-asparaginase-like protein (Ntn-hydrolase superfamily)
MNQEAMEKAKEIVNPKANYWCVRNEVEEDLIKAVAQGLGEFAEEQAKSYSSVEEMLIGIGSDKKTIENFLKGKHFKEGEERAFQRIEELGKDTFLTIRIDKNGQTTIERQDDLENYMVGATLKEALEKAEEE